MAPDDSSADHVAGLARASAMVASQAGCDAVEGLELMIERARVEGVKLDDVVSAVLDGGIRFGRE